MGKPTPYKSNPSLLKTLDKVAFVISVIVIGLVIAMRPADRVSISMDTSWIPAFNACVNTLAAMSLLTAVYFIKRKNVEKHKLFIFVSMFLSFIFLMGYVLYHFTTPETTYCFQGTIRTVYFIILISHIILAGLSLPFILMTFNRGFTFMVESHKKFTKWVYPIWLYVMLSGPLVYLMLRPCYQ